MRLKKILQKIDQLLCSYFGIYNSKITPNAVKLVNNELIVTNTESYRRHIYKNKFNSFDLNHISNVDKEKLGIATGKAIAKNLVVSFEKTQITRKNHE